MWEYIVWFCWIYKGVSIQWKKTPQQTETVTKTDK